MGFNHRAGLLVALLATQSLAAPAFRGSLFPNGAATTFIDAFKATNRGNAEFTCSKNGLPCDAIAADEEGLDDDDGVTRISVGGLSANDFVDEDGVQKSVISGEVYNQENSHFADAAFSDDFVDDVEFGEFEEVEEEETVDQGHSSDSRHTCTKNGFPCGQFPEGSQRELNVERTSSCTRNGIPCEEFVDSQDADESFTVNKSNDSYKTCTRNGMPCEEWERLAAAGQLPDSDNSYTITNGGEDNVVPQEEQVGEPEPEEIALPEPEVVRKRVGRSRRPLNIVDNF